MYNYLFFKVVALVRDLIFLEQKWNIFLLYIIKNWLKIKLIENIYIKGMKNKSTTAFE